MTPETATESAPEASADEQDGRRRRTRRVVKAEEHALRKRQVVELRRAGYTVDEIGDRIGVSHQHVSRLFKAAILDTYRAPAEEARDLELLRTDGLLRRWWPDAIGPDPVAAERAAKQLRWILPYRAQLLNLLRPAPIDVTVNASATLQFPADSEAWALLEAFRRNAEAPIEATAQVSPPPALGNGHVPTNGSEP